MSAISSGAAPAHVLITGGSDGIGRALAERYLAAGCSVMVTGRDPDKLGRAAASLPGLMTFMSDVSRPEEREALADHIRATMPRLSILINNAGMQRRVPLAADTAPWPERQQEIDTLLSGPIHLTSLLIPLMLSHGATGMVVNVTSGGAYIPQVFAPLYSACKAGLHSYTVTLRHALRGTPIRVVELIPPAVRTALAGAGATHGAPLEEFADSMFAALTAGETEVIGFGMTDTEAFRELTHASDSLFALGSQRFPVATYAGDPTMPP